jgi:hypothetical protein
MSRTRRHNSESVHFRTDVQKRGARLANVASEAEAADAHLVEADVMG